MDYTRIIIRHDISENWFGANPILEEGEVGIDLTLNKAKFGDGEHAWNDLPWSTVPADEISALENTVANHVEDYGMHVTQEEKDNWDAKSDFSGSYDDLTDKPAIPVVGNGTVTINQGGELKGSFTMNQTGDTVINLGQGVASVGWDDVTGKPDFAQVATSGSYGDLTGTPTIPTSTSDLTNDSGFLTEVGWNDVGDKPSFAEVATSGAYSDLTGTPSLSAVAISGDYSDLSNAPTIGNGTVTIMQGGESKGSFTMNQTGDTTITLGQGMSSVDWSDVTNKPNFAAVATSGAYSDLSGTPTIPTSTSELTNDSGYLTSVSWNDVASKPTFSDVATSGDYSDLSNTPNLATVAETGSYDDLADKPSIPSSTSDLTNDSGFVSDSSYVHTDNNFTNEEKAKLSGIESGAEANVNADWNAASGDAQILNKPSLAAVATSGAYSDLTGTPTIPTVPTNVSAFTNDAGYLTSVDYGDITNKPVLSAVATSGSYSDLSGTPTIGNGTVTIMQGGESKGSFTMNQTGDTTITLGQGVASVSWEDVTGKPTFSTVATSGSYDDLSDKPTILDSGDFKTINSSSIVGSGDIAIKSFEQDTVSVTSGTSLTVAENTVYRFTFNPTQLTVTLPDSQYESDIYFTAGANFHIEGISNSFTVYGSRDIINGEDYAIAVKDGAVVIAHDGESTLTVDWSNVYNKPNFANVATSGSYADLSNTPTIPSATSDLTNDSGFITGVTWNDVTSKPTFASVATSGDYTDLSNTPTIPTVPTNVSAFTNDAGYLTTVDYSDVTNTPNLANVATSGAYADLTGTPTIPTVPTNVSAFTNDAGYITGVSWNDVGNKPSFANVATSGDYADLSNTPAIPTATSDLTNDSGFITGVDWADVTGKPSFSTVATSGSYDDLSDKPTIPTVPTNVSAFTNDAGYITGVAWNDVTSKPTFASVATSGDYVDLYNTPSIPSATSDLTNDSDFVSDSSYVHTENNYTTSEKEKLSGIQAGAEANVNADWNAASGVAQVLNKPSMQTYEITFTLSDNTTVTKTFWVQS